MDQIDAVWARSRAIAEDGREVRTRRARPRSHEAVAAGGTALREHTAAPSQLARVSRWLRPEHFAWPSDGALYVVMRDMAAAGMPVDPVTVSWHAARCGVRATWPGVCECSPWLAPGRLPARRPGSRGTGRAGHPGRRRQP